MSGDYNYLRPKVKNQKLGDRKRQNGMFMNPPSYPGLGGFYDDSLLPQQEPKMALETGGPFAHKGKPI